MNHIPSYRAAHLFPYIELLNKIGAPVQLGLRKARLPTIQTDQPELRLPVMQTLEFLAEISHSQGIDELPLRAREHIKVSDLSPVFVRSVSSSPTLKAALESFFKLASLECTQFEVWMSSKVSEVRLCSRVRLPFDAEKIRLCEVNTQMMLVAIIRAFAGSQWCPDMQAFQSPVATGQFSAQLFPNTQFLTGQTYAWINLPGSLLNLPPLDKPAHTVLPDSDSLAQLNVVPKWDYSSSLKRVLSAYLHDGYPDIRLAAQIANTSVRTLQRKLAGFGQSYSELIQQARFETAACMLKDPNIKVIDIAYELGYEDPSNFARAFRRISDISPRQYRDLHCQN